MGEVVDLKPKDEEPPLCYWRCECGCLTFYLRSDDEIECAKCAAAVVGDGFWKLPDGETRAENETDPPGYVDIDVGDQDEALLEALRFVKADATTAVAILRENGSVSTWGKKFDTEDRREWLDRKIETARKMLLEHGS